MQTFIHIKHSLTLLSELLPTTSKTFSYPTSKKPNPLENTWHLESPTSQKSIPPSVTVFFPLQIPLNAFSLPIPPPLRGRAKIPNRPQARSLAGNRGRRTLPPRAHAALMLPHSGTVRFLTLILSLPLSLSPWLDRAAGVIPAHANALRVVI